MYYLEFIKNYIYFETTLNELHLIIIIIIMFNM